MAKITYRRWREVMRCYRGIAACSDKTCVHRHPCFVPPEKPAVTFTQKELQR